MSFWSWISAAVLMLSACALPAPEKNAQQFIPEVEVDTVSLFNEGLYFYNHSRYVDAEAKLRQALYLSPDSKAIKLDLAVVLTREGLYSEAISTYRALLQAEPSNTQYLAGLASTYFTMEDYQQARLRYEQALNVALDDLDADKGKAASDPARPAKIARSLSALHFKIGEEEEALCYSELAAALQGDIEQALRHARMLNAAARHEQVVTFIDSFMDRNEGKRDPRIIHQLALAHLGLGNYEEAFELGRMAQRHQGKKATGIEAEIQLALEVVLLKLQANEAQAAAAGAADAEQGGGPRAWKRYLKERQQELKELEDAGEETQDPLDSIYEGKPLEVAASLYWPQEMLEVLRVHAEELEQEQGTSS